MKYRIATIPGDGIGPDVSTAAVRCIEATGVAIEWERVFAGQTALVMPVLGISGAYTVMWLGIGLVLIGAASMVVSVSRAAASLLL